MAYTKEVLERQVELQKLYLRNMQIIKWRLNAIRDIQTGDRKTTYRMTNIEFCVLQIRKILELIAFSSLVSDADVYREKLSKIDSMWNARLIFRDIERIHPDFYPKPIRIDPKDKSIWHDIEDGYLTKDEFIKIYDKCGKYLHENSPFMSNQEIDHMYNEVWNQITDWGTKIINLLNTHIVCLYNQTDLFLIQMGDPPSGNIFTNVVDVND